MGSIEDRRRRAQADRVLAEERAHRIASAAAEALVRSEGVSTARRDEYLFPSGGADPHVRDCIEHLVWHGRAMSLAQARGHLGHLLVQLGDFTLGGGAWPAPTSRPSSTASSSSALAEPQEPDLWGAGYEAGYAAGMAERPAEPVQEGGGNLPPPLHEPAQDHFPDVTKMVQAPTGCDHCRHPLHVATQCRVCGRVTA